METNIEFQMPKNQSSVIKVLGIGGGGSNAVNYMFEHGIKGVDFVVCNTDSQALEASPVPIKIQLGITLTDGLGAGSNPAIGKKAAEESIDRITELLDANTKMLFITAGMGGGTGTGASPVIAEAAREKGILTVGVVTNPFSTEGGYRKQYAKEGLDELRRYVDTLLIINNDKLLEVYGDLTITGAFAKANEVLNTATKGIAEVISQHLLVNIDLNDARKVLENSGTAVMGQAQANGENRAIEAVLGALDSPLLNDNDITGAEQVLLKIVTGSGEDEIKMSELNKIKNKIQEAAGNNVNIIEGIGIDSELGDSVSVTVIATGFEQTVVRGPVVVDIDDETDLDVLNDNEVSFDSNEDQIVDLGSDIELEGQQFIFDNKIDDYDKSTNRNHLEQLDNDEIQENESEAISSEQLDNDEIQENESEAISSEQLDNDEIQENESEAISSEQLDNDEIQENESEAIEFDFEMDLPEDLIPKVKQDSEIENKSNQDQLLNTTLNTSSDSIKIESREREERLRTISKKLRTPSGLSDLEDEPAYKRDNVELEDSPHSSESEMSRYTLTEEDDNVEIKSNNSFLHDNVD